MLADALYGLKVFLITNAHALGDSPKLLMRKDSALSTPECIAHE